MRGDLRRSVERFARPITKPIRKYAWMTPPFSSCTTRSYAFDHCPTLASDALFGRVPYLSELFRGGALLSEPFLLLTLLTGGFSHEESSRSETICLRRKKTRKPLLWGVYYAYPHATPCLLLNPHPVTIPRASQPYPERRPQRSHPRRR